MRVLIIEDDEDKRRSLVECITDGVSGAVISQARSLRSGLVEVLKEDADVILVDMSMPTYDIGEEEHGGTPQAFAGRDLLRHMSQRDILTPVIVVTQFETFGQGTDLVTLEQLDAELRAEHESYLGTIYYDAASEEWKEQLISAVAGVPEP